MALCYVTFYGEKLERENVMRVWLPDRVEYGGPYPVLYLLNSNYQLLSRYQHYADKLPLIIVAPDNKRSYCVDAPDGPAHESHVIYDVVSFVDRYLPTVPAREARALTGQSMGGTAAMKLAVKYPKMFGSVVSQGGAFRRGSHNGCWNHEAIIDDYWRLFGSDPEGGPDDIFALAEKLDPMEAPAIRFEAGVVDVLNQHSQDLHQHLEDLGVPHQFIEYPGGHDFDIWDTHLQNALDFMWQTLGQTVPA